MEKFLEQLLRLLENGEKCALCSVIGRSGSVPAPANAKLLVKEDGTIVGTVGGGALEAEVKGEAQRAISAERPAVINFDFRAQAFQDSLQICGGRISLFIEVIFPTEGEKEFFSKVLQEIHCSHSVVLVLAVESSYRDKPPAGHRLLFNERGILAGGLARPEWNERVRETVSGLLEQEDPLYLELENRPEDCPELEGFLVEFIHPAPTLVVFGGGHRCAYIGKIGSRRKIKLVWEQLEKNGVERALLECVHAPVGLGIRAETPEEIAVSIMAEIIKTRRKRKPEIRKQKI